MNLNHLFRSKYQNIQLKKQQIALNITKTAIGFKINWLKMMKEEKSRNVTDGDKREERKEEAPKAAAEPAPKAEEQAQA